MSNIPNAAMLPYCAGYRCGYAAEAADCPYMEEQRFEIRWWRTGYNHGHADRFWYLECKETVEGLEKQWA